MAGMALAVALAGGPAGGLGRGSAELRAGLGMQAGTGAGIWDGTGGGTGAGIRAGAPDGSQATGNAAGRALARAGAAAGTGKGGGAIAGERIAARGASTLVVGDDRGGALPERLRRVRRLRRDGTVVEIRGRFCLSACTLYLGLPETCVLPGTRFGFHGPATRLPGVALAPDSFERWSRRMAAFYPQPLRDWFMDTARHRIVGFYALSGQDLIRMGLRRCAGR